jgi:alcohol dehydrogenase
VTHGKANALLLPYVMAYNAPAAVERFGRIAAQMGLAVEGLSPRDAAGEAVRACRQLADDVGIPRRLRDVGISEEQLGELVAGALGVTRLLKNNPRPLRPEDIETIFRQTM